MKIKTKVCSKCKRGKRFDDFYKSKSGKHGLQAYCKTCIYEWKSEQHHLFFVLEGMKTRCYNANTKENKRYGSRGISICDEWRDNRFAFIDWGIANGWREGLQIDRIDNDGNYEPSNCRFVDSKTNNRNRPTCKLNTHDVMGIKLLLLQREFSGTRIGRMYNVTRGVVCSIKKGRRKEDIAPLTPRYSSEMA